MKKSILFVIFVCFISLLSAQSNLNAYKYVVVPKKFDFQKSDDQYQFNSLTKFLFDREGFTTLFEGNDFPQDLYNNACLGLKTKVVETSNMFTTKLKIELSNCRNETVFTSIEGKSKIKEFKKGYHDALRKAFESVKAANYNYDPNLSESIKREVVRTEKIEEAKPKVEDKLEEIVNEKPVEVIEKVEATSEQVSLKESTVIELPATTINDNAKNILYAQSIKNGFQLVDSTPKKVFVALKSLTEDLYYLNEKAGIIYKEGEKWFAEYYKDNRLVKEELNIKF